MADAEFREAARFLWNLDNLLVQSDSELDQMWEHRRLPLIRIDIPDTTWSRWSFFADEKGVFVDKAGTRFRAEPEIASQDGSTQRLIPITYEALVVAQIMWEAFSTKRVAQERGLPSQAPQEAFDSQFLRKVPREWREVILSKDLHLGGDPTLKQTSKVVKPPKIHNTLADPTNIRVVSIHSALESKEYIRCSLHEVRLDSLPDFEALSYVWGSSVSEIYIHLDGVKFSVTENLYSALKNLRKRDSDRIMWIDAICINQSDEDEKGAQVAQMDAIYKQATEVVVWLGPKTNTSSMLFSSIGDVQQLSEPVEPLGQSIPAWEGVEYPMSWGIHFANDMNALLGDETPESRNPWSVWSHLHRLPPSNLQRWEETVRALNNSERERRLWVTESDRRERILDSVDSCCKLLQRHYWKRMWVLQEVILARQLTVQCGRQSANWITFHHAVFALLRLAKKICWGGKFSIGRPFNLMQDLQQLVRDIYPFVFLRSKALSVGMPVAQPLATFLSITAASQATNPLDKVYGLLGLLLPESTARNRFTPNYRQPMKSLSIDVTRFFLDTMRSLDVLTARPSKTKNTSKGLPSWVPDWTTPPDPTCNSISMGIFSNLYTRSLFRRASRNDEIQQSTPIFQAGLEADTEYPHTFTCSDEIFDVYGIEVDEIDSVFPLVPDPTVSCTIEDLKSLRPEDIANDSTGWKEQIKSRFLQTWDSRWNACQRVWDDVYGHTGEPLQDAFWRTLFLDRFYDSFGSSPKLLRIPGLVGPMDASELFNHPGMPPYDQNGLAGCLFPPQTQADKERILNYLMSQAHDGIATYETDLHGIILSFIITRNGYIGIGHPGTSKGDKVVVLRGGPVPYILRKSSEGNILVGECYIHGIMDGELLHRKKGDSDSKTGQGIFTKYRII